MTLRSLPPRRQTVGLLAIVTLMASVALVTSGPATAADPATDPLITTEDTTWSYLDDNTEPQGEDPDVLGWTRPGYDDAAWGTAVGAFGAIRGELGPVSGLTPRTLLDQYQAGTTTNVPTFFFRTEFEVAPGSTEGVESLEADLVFDDAVRIYLNGDLVASYLDGRATDATRNLQYAGESGGAPVGQTFDLDPALLEEGTNTLAVALYQDRETSSDIYFDFRSLTPVLPGAPDPSVPPTRVILTPTDAPETSQAFSWLAGDEATSTGTVQIRPVAGGTTRTLRAYSAGDVNGNPLQHFSTTVGGLRAATAYTYRVGVPGAWSPWHEFTTADPTATDFSFVYYGDAQIGLDTTWPQVVDQAMETAPDAVGSVHAGDLIDTASNETQWVNWFDGMQNAAATTNVMAAPGNHEYSGDKLLTAWKANFEYPLNQPTTETVGAMADLAVGDTDVARQYAAYFEHWSDFAAETVYFSDYQGMRFITLNATRDQEFLRPPSLPDCKGEACPSTMVGDLWTQYQAAWLDHVLETSPSKWNVVTFHQPVYSASAGRDEPVLREHWVPVFQEHDIDLVMMGHDHTYARGYNDQDRTDVDGITDGPVYIVSNSGAKHYELESDEDNVWTNNGATQVLRGAGVTTYQVIEVSDDTLIYRSYLAEKTAEATTDLPVGAVYDEFTVTKDDAGRKYVTEAGVEAPIDPVEDGPAFTTQPRSQTLLAGRRAVLRATASSAAGTPVTYQWQERRRGSASWTPVSGATGPALDLGTVDARRDRSAFRVVVTAGGVSVTSAVAMLRVERRATQVRVRAGGLRAGAPARVGVRPSQAGRVRVVVTRGSFRTTRSVPVAAGALKTVRLPRVLPRGPGRMTVRVTLQPRAPQVYAPATRTVRTRVR